MHKDTVLVMHEYRHWYLSDMHTFCCHPIRYAYELLSSKLM